MSVCSNQDRQSSCVLVLHLKWAMVIRRRDAEAGADADAETQITIDFEAEGSSMDAYQKQFGSSCEVKLTQIGCMRDADMDTISFVETQKAVEYLCQALSLLVSEADI